MKKTNLLLEKIFFDRKIFCPEGVYNTLSNALYKNDYEKISLKNASFHKSDSYCGIFSKKNISFCFLEQSNRYNPKSEDWSNFFELSFFGNEKDKDHLKEIDMGNYIINNYSGLRDKNVVKLNTSSQEYLIKKYLFKEERSENMLLFLEQLVEKIRDEGYSNLSSPCFNYYGFSKKNSSLLLLDNHLTGNINFDFGDDERIRSLNFYYFGNQKEKQKLKVLLNDLDKNLVNYYFL